MITKIVEKLKTGTVKNVIPFGWSLPAAPYVVVKMERDSLGRGIAYRIIAHFKPGQNIFLEDYVMNELMTLLDGYAAITRHGTYQELESTGEWGALVTDNDDSTISMERVFLVPGMIY